MFEGRPLAKDWPAGGSRAAAFLVEEPLGREPPAGGSLVKMSRAEELPADEPPDGRLPGGGGGGLPGGGLPLDDLDPDLLILGFFFPRPSSSSLFLFAAYASRRCCAL